MSVTVDDFRVQARTWLEEHKADAPPDWGAIMPAEHRERGMAWQRALYDAGFAGIHWPEEYGGRGLTLEHNGVWQEEAARFAVPAVLNMVGLVLAPGALMTFGTPEQCREHLPPTVQGERVWCQLFSEPGAGSDLASLSTRAERDGDVFVVNGQKVWSSGAHCSDWGILMARTDLDAPKHKGISFFVIDMASEGLETRPLRQMTGDAEFDEVFFTDVRVPAENLVGPLNEGWRVAMGALTNERGFIGASTVSLARRLDRMFAGGLPDDAVLRDEMASLYSTGRALLALGGRQGPQASAASSLLKLGMTELTVEVAMARGRQAGADAMLENDISRAIVGAPGARMGGGTSEIQKNIIGELVLGLPKEPRP